MAEEEKTRQKLWVGLGAALIVGLLLGAGVMAFAGAPAAPAPTKTFTVVAYHWGFAIYDENGQEIPKIEVAEGTVVTLIITPASRLGHEIHEAYEDRLVEAWADNPAFGGKNATEIMAAMDEATTQGLLDHSVEIDGYGVSVVTDHESPSPTIVTFVANEKGTFDIRCNTYCGWGHQYMDLEGGFVVS